MLFSVKHQYFKELLFFAVLASSLIQTFAQSNATQTTSPPTAPSTTVFASTQNVDYCFYGIDASNTSQFVKVCLEDTLEQITFSSTQSDIPSASDLDQIWILLTAAMVFVMQCGFSLMEAGSVKEFNVQTVLFKNLMNLSLTAIGYYLFGFCMSYGKHHSSNTFIGVGDTVILSHEYANWFYEWTFCALVVTISSCAFVERATLLTYFVNTLCLMWWIYPIIVHWLWSETGWLSPFYHYEKKRSHVDGGAIDFAGSCVVHVVAGWMALAGLLFLKSRKNRDKKEEERRGVTWRIVGCLIIWFGYYGFNCGRTLGANLVMKIASKVAVNTTLSSAMSCITVIIIDHIISHTWNVSMLCGGVLAGLVSISASCSVVAPWMSIIIGCVGGIVYILSVYLERCADIDDPLTVWPTFGVGGFWGMIAVGFFAYREQSLLLAGYNANVARLSYGMLWGRQLLAPCVVSAWAFGLGIIVFGILFAIKKLRVSEDAEKNGIDNEWHSDKVLGWSLMSFKK